MSFLQNVKTLPKVLAPLIVMSLVAIASTIYLCWNYLAADSAYSDFIEKDNAVLVLISRSNTSMNAAAYTAYRVLTYDAGSPEMQELVKGYEKDRKNTIDRLEAAKTLTHEGADALEDLIAAARSIFQATDQAVEQGARNENAIARGILREQDAAIAQFRRSIQNLTDKNVRSIEQRSEALTADTKVTIETSLAVLALVLLSAITASLAVTVFGITRPLNALRQRMLTLAEGETSSPVVGIERKDEVGQMASAVAIFRQNAIERVRLEQAAEESRNLSERERLEREREKAGEAAALQAAVSALATALEHLSDGDVTHRIQEPFGLGLDTLRTNFNASSAKLERTLQAVEENTRSINAGANEMRASADDLAKRTEQQAASVEETAAALEEITTAVKDSARRADEAGILVSRTRQGAERSGGVVREAIDAMQRIEQSSGEITNIISVIDEIAFQTNLLALNAGVEAARAGEAGKGFAVVAQEVRELAQRSAAAAKDIKTLIGASGEQVRTGVLKVRETGEALATIVSEVQEINRNVAAIVEASREQSIGLQEISTAVNQMDQGTQQNAAMVEQTTAATHSLSNDVTTLARLVAQFKLGMPALSAVANGPSPSRSHNTSPVHALERRLSNGLGRPSPAATAEQWQEF